MQHVLSLTGELTISTAAELRSSLQQALMSATELELDLTAVDRVDTAAAQLLLAAQRDAAGNGGALTCACPASLRDQLTALGIRL